MLRFLLCLFLSLPALGAPLGYDSNPLGTLETPLILRTFVPDPGLDPKVLAHHFRAFPSPRYNARKGQDVDGEYEMIKTIPAAIAVNHGPALSYVFDTTECRLLYAWQGGFFDMFPYWGAESEGNRRSFDYVPRLVGNLFYLASPESDADSSEAPKFLGYDLTGQIPTFRFKQGVHENWLRVEPAPDQELSFRVSFAINGSEGQKLVSGKILSRHSGFDRTIQIDEPDLAAGRQVFLAYGCIACHSTDGSQGHGPTLARLFGSTRLIEGGEPVLADEAYLRESILEPNAKTAKGYPPNYMPPYQMKDKEMASVILYLKSLSPPAPE